MKRKLLNLSFLVASTILSAQTVDVNSTFANGEENYTPQQLVEDIFANTSCITVNFTNSVSNPNYTNTDSEKSYGYFERQNGSPFPFENGIVLTTGSAGGTDQSVGSPAWLGDNDLEIFTEESSFNATTFEFDFVAPVDLNEVRFEYLFASNEYGPFECFYSDGFALIVSGPGIDSANYYDIDGDSSTPDALIDLGGKNIALIPNTNIPVQVTNIIPESTSCGGKNQEWYNYELPESKYSGETLPMEAIINVIPGETYHVKMVIADSRDSAFDSAVFLNGNSFILPDFYFDEIDDDILLVEDSAGAGSQLPDYSDLLNINYNCLSEEQIQMTITQEEELTIVQTPEAGTIIHENTLVTLEVTDHILNKTHDISFMVDFIPVQIGIEESAFEKFKIYPNPSNGTIYINNYEQIASFKVFDYRGAEVCDYQVLNKTIDLQNLENGIYFLEIENREGEVYLDKLILE
ncbi:choice-of-anchor L domain-containing protein [Aureivirga marina]|uniref:choice-of-anchor L domain-containing protein n=1 Tax=Aureivirga marina TaxID=1182451 RepID=UPI0018C8F2A6|nr:choice-of-anchor L domain-containing protein [Aureivirga marina]